MKRFLPLLLGAFLALPLLADDPPAEDTPPPGTEVEQVQPQPPPVQEDSALVAAAKRNGRGRMPARIITNATVKASKGHLTTTKTQRPIDLAAMPAAPAAKPKAKAKPAAKKTPEARTEAEKRGKRRKPLRLPPPRKGCTRERKTIRPRPSTPRRKRRNRRGDAGWGCRPACVRHRTVTANKGGQTPACPPQIVTVGYAVWRWRFSAR